MMKSGHLVDIRITQSAPIIMILGMAVIIQIIKSIVTEEQLQKWGFTLSSGLFYIDEDLPAFFETLYHTKSEYLIAENRQMQSRYGFEIYESNMIDKLS